MERPKGVTLLACLYMFLALGGLLYFIPGQGQTFRTLFDTLLQRPGLLANDVGIVILGVTLGIGLLRMKNWSRWLAIIVNATNLLFVANDIGVTHRSMAVIRGGVDRGGVDTLFVVSFIGVHILFIGSVIWYLTRSHVKDEVSEWSIGPIPQKSSA